MDSRPWDNWIPGVLSKRQVRELCDQGYIVGVTDPERAIDASSIDLFLSNEGWQLPEGSVKPKGERYKHFLDKHHLCKPLVPGTGGIFILTAKQTYLFKLSERLDGLDKGTIYGQATAKSSVGRMDVLARLIVDGMDGYENFTPEGLKTGNGDLYLEITPITFNVRVKAGISLSQLRFFYAEPRLSEMRGEELYKTLLRQSKKNDGTLSVDLSPTKINDHEVAAFCANEMDEKGEPIDLWKTSQDSEKPDPCKFWKFLKANENERLKIEKGAFYILRSKERIQLPKGVAVYCRAIDETIGEMRIHYAGFVHPFFGTNRKDSLIGTPLIFEVRGHDLNVNLVDEEKMARLTFYRMSEDADDGDSSTAYNEQVLQLSTFFRDWPNKISVDASGNVTPRE